MLTTRNSSGVYVPFESEINRIVLNLKENNCNKDKLEVSLIDDVIYSGNGIVQIIEKLKESGVEVKQVLSAVCVDKAKTFLKSKNLEVIPFYTISNCLDEICERDFYFGVAQSGQNILTDEGILEKQPYFYPFGKPNEYASIPENKEKEFSLSCIDRSIELWQDIENQSSKIATYEDIPEKIFNTPNEYKIVELLKESREELCQ